MNSKTVGNSEHTVGVDWYRSPVNKLVGSPLDYFYEYQNSTLLCSRKRPNRFDYDAIVICGLRR